MAKLCQLITDVQTLDSEADTPSRIPRRHNLPSSSYWFTKSCYSACLSHFAAPLIIILAKTSDAENSVSARFDDLQTSPSFSICWVKQEAMIPKCAQQATALLAVSGISECFWWKSSEYSWHFPHMLTAPARDVSVRYMQMILPQVHLRKPCYDFSFL